MCEQRLSKIHFFILLSLFGFVFPLRSQEYKFRTLGVEDGLSQITVSDICQDEKSRICEKDYVNRKHYRAGIFHS